MKPATLVLAAMRALKHRVGRRLQRLVWAQQREAHESSPHLNQRGFPWTPTPEAWPDDRAFWVHTLRKMVYPVIDALARGALRQEMPLETGAHYFMRPEQVSGLEALGRTMAGIAPWLALPDDETAEGVLRAELRQKLLTGLAQAVDPDSPDYLPFSADLQNVVDAAYVAHGFLRAPQALWEPLDPKTRQCFIREFKSLRQRYGSYNNWLLFSALVEAFLLSVDEDHDPARIRFAIEKVREWYVGDGWYSDGPRFSMDYYNAFVMHSMAVDLLDVLRRKHLVADDDHELAIRRMTRHAAFQERLISPEGFFPPFGRSITYRSGAFQALAHTALIRRLPDGIAPSQVRSALTAVLRNLFERNQNFDASGWLVLGFNGYQPMLADPYTSTGSLYMATLVFLPLGLPAHDEFWSAQARPWSAVRAWQGGDLERDYKVDY